LRIEIWAKTYISRPDPRLFIFQDLTLDFSQAEIKPGLDPWSRPGANHVNSSSNPNFSDHFLPH
jgi:hypothetical protein